VTGNSLINFCYTQVENLTVSFSDGRAFCLLVHHYYPQFLPLEDVQSCTSVSQQGGVNVDCSPNDSFGASMTYSVNHKLEFDHLMENERKNFKLFHAKVGSIF